MDVSFLYSNGVLNKNKLRFNWFKSNYPLLYDEVMLYNKSNDSKKFSKLLYNFLNGISFPVLCSNCNINEKRFIGYTTGYNNFCSKKCASSNSRKKEIVTRRKNTILKYGVDHTSKLESVKEKQKTTNLKKYGVVSPTLNINIVEKQNSTMLERYGVKYSGQSQYLLSKSLSTRFKKYVDEVKLLYNDLDIFLIEKEGEVNINCKICSNDYLIKTNLLRLRYFRYEVNPCLICNPLSSYKYSGQNEIYEYIKQLGFDPKIGNRDVLNGKEIDIYLPDLKIGFEFNGLYWHSDIHKDKKYHLNKKQIAESKNINLIHIWEDDWLYKKDIIKSRINNLLKLNNKIYSRRCLIKEVDQKTSETFLDQNHLQGSLNSKYNIGLYHDGKLVSIMCFGHKSKNDVYEIYRFSSILNHTVIGAFSKLLNYFINKFSPKEIITYANRDWSILSDNTYIKNGFNFEKVTDIGYFYFSEKETKRYHRYQFRKHKLIKDEIMMERGYFRIWDCGHIKYSLKINI